MALHCLPDDIERQMQGKCYSSSEITEGDFINQNISLTSEWKGPFYGLWEPENKM